MRCQSCWGQRLESACDRMGRRGITPRPAMAPLYHRLRKSNQCGRSGRKKRLWRLLVPVAFNGWPRSLGPRVPWCRGHRPMVHFLFGFKDGVGPGFDHPGSVEAVRAPRQDSPPLCSASLLETGNSARMFRRPGKSMPAPPFALTGRQPVWDTIATS